MRDRDFFVPFLLSLIVNGHKTTWAFSACDPFRNLNFVHAKLMRTFNIETAYSYFIIFTSGGANCIFPPAC